MFYLDASSPRDWALASAFVTGVSGIVTKARGRARVARGRTCHHSASHTEGDLRPTPKATLLPITARLDPVPETVERAFVEDGLEIDLGMHHIPEFASLLLTRGRGGLSVPARLWAQPALLDVRCDQDLAWDADVGRADQRSSFARSRVHVDPSPIGRKEEGHFHGGAGWDHVRSRGPDKP